METNKANNTVSKPKAYADLSDYEYALTQILNALPIFIYVNGMPLNAKTFMPLTISQIIRISNMYTAENALSNGLTNYIVHVKSECLSKLKSTDATLASLKQA